jgi:hypothetical protein
MTSLQTAIRKFERKAILYICVEYCFETSSIFESQFCELHDENTA